jgi:methionyl-tRNA formyltransferase
MLLDAGMDTGPILTQKEVPVSAEDTTGSLTIKLAQAGAQLLLETLPLWLDGQIKPQPQDEGLASYTRVITKNDGEIDWRLPALELCRRVRAFDPWPGCYTSWRGKRLKIVKVVLLDGEKVGEPGRVVALPRLGPAVVGVESGGGVLGLIKVQLEGKREMSAEEFVRGQRDFIGSYLL